VLLQEQDKLLEEVVVQVLQDQVDQEEEVEPEEQVQQIQLQDHQ
jgi:hypothetical protein